MNPATAIPAMIILLFVGFVAVLWLTAMFVSRLLSTVCPHCTARVFKSREDLPCPQCGQSHLQNERSDQAQSGLEKWCHRCETEIRPELGVRMWDGMCYCNHCVTSVSPRLFGLARSNAQFREQMQHSEWDYARLLVKHFLIVLLCFSCIAAVVSWDLWIAFGLFFVIAMVGLPLVLLLGVSAAFSFRRDRPAFTACNGKLFIRVGAHIFDVALEDCTWFEGKASQTNMLKFGQRNDYSSFLRGSAIVVQIPWTFSQPGDQLSVGFTQQTYEIWKAFFTLAGVPQPSVRKQKNRKLHDRIVQWWLSPA